MVPPCLRKCFIELLHHHSTTAGSSLFSRFLQLLMQQLHNQHTLIKSCVLHASCHKGSFSLIIRFSTLLRCLPVSRPRPKASSVDSAMSMATASPWSSISGDLQTAPRQCRIHSHESPAPAPVFYMFTVHWTNHWAYNLSVGHLILKKS